MSNCGGSVELLAHTSNYTITILLLIITYTSNYILIIIITYITNIGSQHVLAHRRSGRI